MTMMDEKLKAMMGGDRKKEGITKEEPTRECNTEEVKIIKIVTQGKEPGFCRFYKVTVDNSKEEHALRDMELLEILDQVTNKIQDYRQFGLNEAEHPHSMVDYKQRDKERDEKLELDENSIK